MSRIELDCKHYKCFDNNKCDQSCKKLLKKARIRTVQGLGLKNAEIKKKNMMRATYLTKLAFYIPKHIDGATLRGHVYCQM